MKFQGCWTALVTPFQKDGGLDEDGFRRLVRHQIKGGVSGLVPCGSTGESATLTHDEHRRVIELTLQESQGDVPVMAGIGTNATWKAMELAREAESMGVDALLLLAPYYNKPTQEGLFAHFTAVCSRTRLPVMIYNIPGRTGVNVAPATLARVAKACPNAVAVKEAAGSLDQVSEIRVKAPKVVVLSGDDSLTVPMMSVGAKGVVSVLSNAAPKLVSSMVDAFLKGKNAQAQALHLKSFPLIKALFAETNPIPVKAALELMGLCRAEPRLPLTTASAAVRAQLKAELKTLGLL